MSAKAHQSVSVVIPTIGVSDDLHNCLESISCQTRLPEEVIVVNDGKDRIRHRIQENLDDRIKLIITESTGQSSSASARNTGAVAASSDIILFLDEDTTIGAEYIEKLANSFKGFDRKTVGLCGFDKNLRERGRLEEMFRRLFYLETKGWKVNKAGIHSWDPTVDEQVESDWITANNAAFRSFIFNEYRFRSWSQGRVPLEDVQFGWELTNDGYTLIVDPDLPITHLKSESETTTDPFKFGVKRGRNRVRMFRQSGQRKHYPLLVWAAVGECLHNILAPMSNGDVLRHIQVLLGIFVGFVMQLASVNWS